MLSSANYADSRASYDLLSLIGHTPLIRLSRITQGLPDTVEVYAKAEWFNPGGSVKDRPALSMILDGEEKGKLKSGKIILDATSGNTGIAYAMIGAAKGYRVRLCIASNVSPERKSILRAYGAELICTDPSESSDGAIRTARGLREYTGNIETISFQPDSGFHGLEGLKHMGTAIVPGIYDPSVADRDLAVDTDEAYGMVRLLAREEGLLVGISSGAAAVCALRV